MYEFLYTYIHTYIQIFMNNNDFTHLQVSVECDSAGYLRLQSGELVDGLLEFLDYLVHFHHKRVAVEQPG